MIARGRADMAMALGITPQRARKVLLTRPYLSEHCAPVVNRVLDARVHAWLTEEFETVYRFSRHPEHSVKLKTIGRKDDPLSGGIAVPWYSRHFPAWLNLFLELNDHDPRATSLIRRYLRPNRNP